MNELHISFDNYYICRFIVDEVLDHCHDDDEKLVDGDDGGVGLW